MGLPKIKFTPDAIWSFVANHGEKILVAIVVLCSLPLAWSGINALRLKTRSSAEEPAEIMRLATNAKSLLSRPLAPDQQAEITKNLQAVNNDPGATLESWNPKDISRLSADTGINLPLIDGVNRRKTPTVFPIVDLFATAGIAAIADRNNAPMEPLMGMSPNGEMGMSPDGEMGDQQNLQQVVFSPPATKMPYVILSGLIPYKKQMEEYDSLRGTLGAASSMRDIPIWRGFDVERLEIGPSGDGQWKLVNTKSLKTDLETKWTGYATSPLPQQFRIPDAQNFYGDFPLKYWGGLPVLAAKPTLGTSNSGYEGGSGESSGALWGLEGIHPWVKDELKRLSEEQWKLNQEQQENSRFGGEGMYGDAEDGSQRTSTTNQTTVSPFSNSQEGMEGEMAGDEFDGGQPTYGMEDEGALANQEYCIFRLVDTSVKPGHSYRYKVTLNVWNPNYELPKGLLEDPSSSVVDKIESATSEIYPSLDSNPILVPADTQLFARNLFGFEPRQYGLKGGANKIEFLVLHSNPDSHNFELQSIESTPGDIVGAKKGERKVRNRFDSKKPFEVPPYDVKSDQTFLAMAGEQIIKPPENKWTPPDPLEVLIVDKSGNLTLITTDASADLVLGYLPTIPGFMPSTASGEGM